jgi:hypothetical protein
MYLTTMHAHEKIKETKRENKIDQHDTRLNVRYKQSKEEFEDTKGVIRIRK